MALVEYIKDYKKEKRDTMHRQLIDEVLKNDIPQIFDLSDGIVFCFVYNKYAGSFNTLALVIWEDFIAMYTAETGNSVPRYEFNSAKF